MITKGNVGACRYLLEQEGLLQFFGQVFEMVGQCYSETGFDRAPGALAAGRRSRGRAAGAQANRGFMDKEGLSADGACLVEDDPTEIRPEQGF